MDVVLAVDIGSTSCKAAYLDKQGRMVATGRVNTRQIPVARTETLSGFWEAFGLSVHAASAQLADDGRVSAIGIACRSFFGACIDAAGKAYWPSWDAKLSRNAPVVQRALSPEIWGAKDPFAYGYGTWFGALISWLREARPDEWNSIHRVGALRDYIVYEMTGEWVTDPATGPGQHEWPDELVGLTGLSRDALPLIMDPHAGAGGLTVDAAAALGLLADTPVVVGQHDGAAANLGVGAIRPGDGCFTFGTNFVFRGVTGERLTTKSMNYLVAPEIWAWVGNIPGASQQFETATSRIAHERSDAMELHAELGPLAHDVESGANGLRLDLVSPDEDEKLYSAVAAARQAGHSEAVVYRALLEAVAFGELGLVQRARENGADPQRFVATGGGARNNAFMQVLASVLDVSIEVGEPDGGLVGAGMAAAIGAGWYASVDEAVAGMCASGPIIRPDPAGVEYYRGRHQEKE